MLKLLIKQLFSLFFLSSALFLSAEDTFSIPPDSLLIEIRNHNFEGFSYKIDAIQTTLSSNDETLINLLKEYEEIIKNEGFHGNAIIEPTIENLDNDVLNALQHLSLGLYTLYYQYDDGKAYKHLLIAKDYAFKTSSKVLQCEVYKGILNYYLHLISIDDTTYISYLEDYKNLAYDELELYIYYLYYGYFGSIYKDYSLTDNDIKQLLELQEKYKAHYYGSFSSRVLGTYYELKKQDYTTAHTVFQQGLSHYSFTENGTDINLYQRLIIGNAIVLFYKNNFQESISELKKVDTQYECKQYLYNSIFRDTWLAKNYEKLQLYDSAYFYKDRSSRLKNEFDQYIHNAKIQHLNVENKEKELSLLKKWITAYKKHKFLFIIGLILVFCLSLYSFIRWKKSDKAKKSFYQKSVQSEKELNKVKELVIKEHITLKNNTKIYVDHLVYIKSDGHYLTFIIENKKNEFVRGKISEILSLLPPNFKKCHKSYIVNTNYITRKEKNTLFLNNGEDIPLSRTYQKDFNQF